MTPSRFALLVLATMLVGGLIGGLLGSSIVSNPFASDSTATSSGGMNDLFNAPFETQHRAWRATFAVAGAALGLGFAGVVGSYASRHRAIRDVPAKT